MFYKFKEDFIYLVMFLDKSIIKHHRTEQCPMNIKIIDIKVMDTQA